MRNALAHAGKSGRRVVSAFIATAFAQDDAERLPLSEGIHFSRFQGVDSTLCNRQKKVRQANSGN
jgi:hypothetical protein